MKTENFVVCVVSLMLLAGCVSNTTSVPPRTAMEQLLLSTADDNTVRQLVIDPLKGKKIFVEDKYFEAYDKGYAISSLREYLNRSGCLLMQKVDEADTIVEIRSGADSMDSHTNLVGIPSMTLPIPLTGNAQTPELALFKDEKWRSLAKFSLYAYDKGSGKFLYATDPVYGVSRYYHYKLLFVGWQKTDIPALNPKEKKFQFKDDLK